MVLTSPFFPGSPKPCVTCFSGAMTAAAPVSTLFLDQVGKGALSTVVAIEMHGHEDTWNGKKANFRRDELQLCATGGQMWCDDLISLLLHVHTWAGRKK